MRTRPTPPILHRPGARRAESPTTGRPHWQPWALLVMAGLCLPGCVVAPYGHGPAPGYGAGYGGTYGGPPPEAPLAVVEAPPPAPLVEVIPVMPFAGAVWVGGYWGWVGGRHTWIAGNWVAPRPGYGWQPHRWVPVQGRWHLMAGGWVRH